MAQPDRTRSFTAALLAMPGGKARVSLPFDPNQAWGTKSLHHVNGTVAGIRVRVTVTEDASGWSFPLSPSRLIDAKVVPGDQVEVVITPEGPQRSDLAPDIAEALESHPDAGAFFDSLAQFYRKGYLRWIDSTKRRPDLRTERIARDDPTSGRGNQGAS